MKANLGSDDQAGDIPATITDQVEESRITLMEAAAEGDDELIMKYLEGEELTGAEMRQGLKAAFKSGTVIPVLCGASTKGIGIGSLLDALLALTPAPNELPPVPVETAQGEEEISADPSEPVAALIFKTMADPYVGKLSYFRVYRGTLTGDSRYINARTREEERFGQLYVMRGKEQLPISHIAAGDIGAVAKLGESVTGDSVCAKEDVISLPMPDFPKPLYSLAVNPRTQADSAKLGSTLTRLTEEDPTLVTYVEPSTKQTILSGMGDAHLDIALRRMENRFGVGVETEIPRVPYEETITRINSAQYRHKKQTGGAGQFAEVHVRVEPLPRGEQFD
jgi:elongation factor G